MREIDRRGRGRVSVRMKREEMFAEGCALVRLIGSLPASRSQVNRGGTPLARECKILTTRLLLHGARCVYARRARRRAAPSMHLELARQRTSAVYAVYLQRDVASTVQKYGLIVRTELRSCNCRACLHGHNTFASYEIRRVVTLTLTAIAGN